MTFELRLGYDTTSMILDTGAYFLLNNALIGKVLFNFTHILRTDTKLPPPPPQFQNHLVRIILLFLFNIAVLNS